MTSGELITWAMIIAVFGFFIRALLVFLPWELIQLDRRREGNESSLTASQFITRIMKGVKGVTSKVTNNRSFWKGMAWSVALILIFFGVVGLWLILHWELPCVSFDVLCGGFWEKL